MKEKKFFFGAVLSQFYALLSVKFWGLLKWECKINQVWTPIGNFNSVECQVWTPIENSNSVECLEQWRFLVILLLDFGFTSG